jgi:hypothetical protein
VGNAVSVACTAMGRASTKSQVTSDILAEQPPAQTRHFLFYFKDAVFECGAAGASEYFPPWETWPINGKESHCPLVRA